MPRQKNPARPSMTEEQHDDALLTHSPSWRFSLVMELCRETIHRRGVGRGGREGGTNHETLRRVYDEMQEAVRHLGLPAA